MLNTVKDVMHRIDPARVGAFAKDFGGSSVDLAKTVGVGSLALARKVGVKRGIAGFAILGAAVGGIMLARYLKRRANETPLLTEEEVGETPAAPTRRRRQSRAKRKSQNAHA